MSDANTLFLLKLFNLRSTDVSETYYSNKNGVLEGFITVDPKDRICEFCSSQKLLSKGYYTRTYNVPFRNNEIINVHLKIKRMTCANCHRSSSASLVVAPKNHKISYASICTIMDLLLEPTMTFKEVSRITKISETTIIRTFDKYCHIQRANFPEVICIDEVYTKNNSFEHSKFSCVFYDFYNHSIIDVTPSRRKHFLSEYLESIPKLERDSVKIVSIDMYSTYRELIYKYFKKAIVCVDSFHVIEHLNNDLNRIRTRIMKSYGTDTLEYYLLKKWKNLLFDTHINLDNEGKFNKRFNRVMTYRQLLEAMLEINTDLKLGYDLKEYYMAFNHLGSKEEAAKMYDSILKAFTEANISEYSEFVTILNNWKEEIINSFIRYRGRRINSSVAESVNSKIATIIYNTHGIRNHERRRKRIIYCVNKTGFTLR